MSRSNHKTRGPKRRKSDDKARMFSVLRILEAIAETDAATHTDSTLEQVNQCPEAFQAGELIEKIFVAAEHTFGETSSEDKILPPPGTVIPLV